MLSDLCCYGGYWPGGLEYVLSFEHYFVALTSEVLHTIHDVEVRGDVILDLIRIDDAMETRWREFFDAVVDSQMRIWIAIGAVC